MTHCLLDKALCFVGANAGGKSTQKEIKSLQEEKVWVGFQQSGVLETDARLEFWGLVFIWKETEAGV